MEILLSSLSGRIAEGTGRTEEEILQQLAKLNKNWVCTVGDWNWLTAERRVGLQLPLLLNSVVDNVVASALADSKDSELHCRDVVVEERTASSLRLRVDSSATMVDLSYSDTLSNALRVLFPGCTQCSVSGLDGKPCDPTSTVLDSLVPGVVVYWTDSNGARFHATMRATYELTTVDRWLIATGLSCYAHKFFHAGVKDFLMLPLLRETAVFELVGDEKGAAAAHRHIQDLLRLTEYEVAARWIQFLGFEECHCRQLCESMEKAKLSLHDLLAENQFGLANLRFPTPIPLAVALGEYRNFSSIEASYRWLSENALEIYAVQFAKSNIPFYILPLVNYFVVYEMGIVIDDHRMYKRLNELRNSPAFNSLAVSLWLRDMELGSYQTRFAALDWHSLEDFSNLPLKVLLDCVDSEKDRASLESGIEELKQFLAFRNLSTDLLEQLGMDQYSELFAIHGVSLQMLPHLTDLHLECMGVSSLAERRRALGIIASLGRSSGPVRRALPPPATMSSHLTGTFPGWQRPTARIPSPAPHGIGDTKTVDEWLQFINGPEPSPGKKKRKRRKKKKKKKSTTFPEVKEGQSQHPSDVHEAAVGAASEDVGEIPGSSTVELDTLARAVSEPKAKEAGGVVVDQGALLAEQGKFHLKPSPTEETLLLGASLKEATECKPSPDWKCEPHVPLSFETSHLSGLEPAKPARHDPFSPELMPLEEFLLSDEFSDEDDMDPELKAQLDAEVEEFRKRLESTHSKSKLTPIFFLPD